VRQTLVLVSQGSLYALPPRMLSLLLAIALAVMLGICAGFVHGVGFVPEHKLWRIAFGPWLAWPLMGMGLWMLLLRG
jgi:predicted membrane protein